MTDDAGTLAALPRRVRALTDLELPGARENLGLHGYDGVVADYSPAGVTALLGAVGTPGEGPDRPAEPLDAALLSAGEAAAHAAWAGAEIHRWNPLVHLSNLDLSCYERAYAPAEERAAARARHLAGWPDAVAAAIESLDRVSAPVATALLPAVRAVSAGVQDEAALAAAGRLVDHLTRAAGAGDPDGSLGAATLAALVGAPQAVDVDLGRLAEQADAERDRLQLLLAESCARLEPDLTVGEVVATLLDDHPTEPAEIYAEARLQIVEAAAFTDAHDLLPPYDGECLVGPAPPARRWAMAMMSWAGVYEPDSPSWYHVTPPDPSWPAEQRAEWLAVFSRTTLPAITVHEVVPGHFSHSRMLRRVVGDVRRCCLSDAFIEGWAHYAEELLLDEGFRADDPRYAVGVALEALVRVTRLAVALGVHTGGMTVAEGARRFEADAYLRGEAALSEANRATFDPTYGRYTWGKLEIRAAADRARVRWGSGFTLRRFHEALLAAGSPPLGLLDACVAAAD